MDSTNSITTNTQKTAANRAGNLTSLFSKSGTPPYIPALSTAPRPSPVFSSQNGFSPADYVKANQDSVRSTSSRRSTLEFYHDGHTVSMATYLANKTWESNVVNASTISKGPIRTDVVGIADNPQQKSKENSMKVNATQFLEIAQSDGIMSSDEDDDIYTNPSTSVRSFRDFYRKNPHKPPAGNEVRLRSKKESGEKSGDEYNKSDAEKNASKKATAKKDNLLGTLKGVYLPCVQNIVGVIVFVRLAWIVGVAGIGQSMLIALLATSCTFLTTLSVCAIATNGRIPAGGAYYMISRSLGKEFGGSVGILFYLANVVGGVMYILGVVEILINNVAPSISLGNAATDARVYGTALVFLIAGIVTIGMNFINRASMLFLAAVILALLSSLTGLLASNRPGLVHGISGFPGNFLENFGPGYAKPDIDGKIYADVGFFTLFGIFFPSVTGIMAGASRSGDLRDPQKSIPVGTLGAQLSTTALYFVFILLFGTVITGDLLRTKIPPASTGGLLVAAVAWPTPWVTLIGCLFASLGAGLQCFVSAPRLLQAVAKDEIIPFLSFFKPLSTPRFGFLPGGEPRRALLLTLIIAECIVLIGNLDFVANVVTMLYLITYMFVNASTSLLGFLRSPNWRPSWRFYHWTVSGFASLLCLACMFMISWYSSIIALVVMGLAYKYIEYRGARVQWGDGLQALNLQVAQRNLLSLQRQGDGTKNVLHVKNWRPQIIAVVDVVHDDPLISDGGEKLTQDGDVQKFKIELPGIVDFLAQLKLGGGLTMLCSIIPGDVPTKSRDGTVEQITNVINNTMKQRHLRAFAEVAISPDVTSALLTAVQTAGVGVLRPNTVLLPYPDYLKNYHIKTMDYPYELKKKCMQFVQTAKSIIALDKALLVVKGLRNFPQRRDRLPSSSTIDVYWIMHDGGILTLLPYLLRKHPVWRRCKLRIFSIAQFEDNSVAMRNALVSSLKHLRIDAYADVLELPPDIISFSAPNVQTSNASIPEIPRRFGDEFDYTYERTVRFKDRIELLKKSGMSLNDNVLMFPSAADLLSTLPDSPDSTKGNGDVVVDVIDELPKNSSALTMNEDVGLIDGGGATISEKENVQIPNKDSEKNYVTPSPISEKFGETTRQGHEEMLNTATKLNALMRQHSGVGSGCELILMNLPGPGASFEAVACEHLGLDLTGAKTPEEQERIQEAASLAYVDYLDALTEGLNERIVFVKGTGREVVTAFF